MLLLALEHFAPLRAPTEGLLLLLLLRLSAEGWHGLLAPSRLELGVPLRLGRPRERGHEATGALSGLLRGRLLSGRLLLTVAALGLESALCGLRLLAVAAVSLLRLLRGLTAHLESGRATARGRGALLLLHGATDGERGRAAASTGVERLHRVVTARSAPHLVSPRAPLNGAKARQQRLFTTAILCFGFLLA